VLSGHIGGAAPGRPVIVYDGECARCRRWIERTAALDRAGRLQTLPLQSADAAHVTGRTPEQLLQAVHLVHPDGGVVHGAAAVRDVLRYLRGGKLVAWLFTLPGVSWMATRTYAWVARRRVTRAVRLTDQRKPGQ
jgi:predicted DCC family thiol-disulfide oxidoreductase YuxK